MDTKPMLKNIFLFLLTLSFQVNASDCPQYYKKELNIPNSIELCKSFFVVLYDNSKDRPILSMAKITSKSGTYINRPEFHDEKNKEVSYDIKNHPKGYDKGHLTAALDSSNIKEFYDTFSYVNTVPQNLALNRGKWRVLEDKMRQRIYASGKETIVYTGGIYENDSIIPTHLYKIVFFDIPEVYIAKNVKYAKIEQITIDELELKVNLDLY